VLHYTYQVTELAEANAEEDECFMAQMATLLQNLRQLWMRRGNRELPARRSEVAKQQIVALERERMEQELRVARLIQQTLLPKDLPALSGWHFSAYYMAAREVGGDFYDFLYFDDGQLGLVIGDVTDKGVPAALVMATVRSMIRSAAVGEVSPGKVLERTNDMLHHDIPPRMFVTCLYAILDPHTGRVRFANAGQDHT